MSSDVQQGLFLDRLAKTEKSVLKHFSQRTAICFGSKCVYWHLLIFLRLFAQPEIINASMNNFIKSDLHLTIISFFVYT